MAAKAKSRGKPRLNRKEVRKPASISIDPTLLARAKAAGSLSQIVQQALIEYFTKRDNQ